MAEVVVMPKFFTKPDYINNKELRIIGDDVSHISKVLRMSAGDNIIVCDGEGNDYDATIMSISKTEVIAEITGKYVCDAEPSVNVTLYQALPKQGKMEYIIQKNIELGVNKIIPVYTKRCVVKPSDKTERWSKVAESAAKQCGRGIIPQVMPAVSFNEAIEQMKEYDLALMPYECEEENGLKKVLQSSNYKNVSIFIGPEGGFDLKEVEAALSAGVKTVTLGKRILRTETAASAVLPIIMYENDEM